MDQLADATRYRCGTEHAEPRIPPVPVASRAHADL